jgi:hypothetical protein
MPASMIQNRMQQMRDWTESRETRTASGLVIPRSRVSVSLSDAVESPNYGSGNQVEILEYQAQAGMVVLFTKVAIAYSGGTPPLATGDFSFSLDIDRPLGTTEGYSVKDWGDVEQLRGSLVPADLWEHEIMLVDGETLRAKIYTIQNVGTGLGNYFTAGLIGFEWRLSDREG